MGKQCSCSRHGTFVDQGGCYVHIKCSFCEERDAESKRLNGRVRELENKLRELENKLVSHQFEKY